MNTPSVPTTVLISLKSIPGAMNREIDPQALREQVSRAEAPLPLGVRLAELDVVLPPELIPPVFEPGAEGIEEARGLWVGAGNVRPP